MSFCCGCFGRFRVAACVAAWAFLLMGAVCSPAAAAPAWRLATAEGTSSLGELARLDASELVLIAADGEIRFPLASVRTIEPAERPAQAASLAVRVWLTDGSVLSSEDVATSGRDLTLQQQGREIVVPQDAVERIAWNPQSGDGQAGDLLQPPAWQSVVPAAVESDLIVIRKAVDPEPVYQAVPCAILSIDAEHVTVALDEDRIPVKRERVAGLVWLRTRRDAEVAGPVVDLTAGRLLTTGVQLQPETGDFQFTTAWSPGFTVPAASIRRIDLAAGRTVSLVTLPPEDIRVEPFFPRLAELDELAVAFQPRLLTAEQTASESRPQMLVMPRTIMRWKLPAGVQRLRMQALVERPQAGGAELAVVVDGTEVFRQAIHERAEADSGFVDVDLLGGRRLEIVVDFPAVAEGSPSGLGRLRLLDPRLEK